ncbi:MAG: FAD-binding oxidoreductase [Neisseriaceae bacterium]|nr:FAD-binding oxidoreductase [Neisseriaceae bacterium]
MNDLYLLFSDYLSSDEIIDDSSKVDSLLRDKRSRFYGRADIVLQPSSVASVQTIVKLCNQYAISITPQGGNTGLCGGAVPDGGVLLSMSRLNRIVNISPADNSITVEAGVTLYQVQQAAISVGRFFPLSLASEGSCQIGGNIACNAGGINVLRYGTMRALVLGLEVVLPNGEIVSHLSPLYKNTTGLDIQQLFIGSEGTLGIITAATLKLFYQPLETQTLWASFNNIEQCIELFHFLQKHSSGRLKSFELIGKNALLISSNDLQQAPPIIDSQDNWHILCELEKSISIDSLPESLYENGFRNIVFAQNEMQSKQWWCLRENISEAQKRYGVSIKHDIAVPIGQLSDFICKNSQRLQELYPESKLVVFGHLGDGSLHYNVFLSNALGNEIYQYENAINQLVYQDVFAHDGTCAAEHGIGLLKRNWLCNMKTEQELSLMRAIKHQLDPNNIMNPNKVYP